MTKAQSAMYSAYSRATATDLWEVYGRCSSAKRAAMQNCRKLQEELDGWGGRICSASCYLFSYAFLYKDEDGDICLCYVTKSHVHQFCIG